MPVDEHTPAFNFSCPLIAAGGSLHGYWCCHATDRKDTLSQIHLPTYFTTEDRTVRDYPSWHGSVLHTQLLLVISWLISR